MGETYEEYCAYMDARGWEPVIEEVWRREYAPKRESGFIPTARNAKTTKVAVTLANHEVIEKKSLAAVRRMISSLRSRNSSHVTRISHG